MWLNLYLLTQVMLPVRVQRLVDSHVRAHLSRKSDNKEAFEHNNVNATLKAGQDVFSDEGFHEQAEPFTRSVAAERILVRRSLQMRSKQEAWHVSIIQTYMFN